MVTDRHLNRRNRSYKILKNIFKVLWGKNKTKANLEIYEEQKSPVKT